MPRSSHCRSAFNAYSFTRRLVSVIVINGPEQVLVDFVHKRLLSAPAKCFWRHRCQNYRIGAAVELRPSWRKMKHFSRRARQNCGGICDHDIKAQQAGVKCDRSDARPENRCAPRNAGRCRVADDCGGLRRRCYSAETAANCNCLGPCRPSCVRQRRVRPRQERESPSNGVIDSSIGFLG